MQTPPGKNLRRAHSLFNSTPDSFIAGRNFFANSWRQCSHGPVSPCPTRTPRHSEVATASWRPFCRTRDETFPKNPEIYQTAELPARLAQSATLDFSHSPSGDAGQNRLGAPPRNSAALCEFPFRIRKIREYRAVVAIK